MGVWQRSLQHPQNLWLHKLSFHIHYLVGVVIAVYVLLTSVSGSIIVYRDELSARFSLEWLVNLHGNLLSGSRGPLVKGFGGICVTLLCLTGAVRFSWFSKALWSVLGLVPAVLSFSGVEADAVCTSDVFRSNGANGSCPALEEN